MNNVAKISNAAAGDDTSVAISGRSVAETLIKRATALQPRLLARQAETEKLGRYPETTHQDLLESGLYRVIQPRRFGGHECDVTTFLKIVIELARGCPSTAWSYSFGVTHQLIAAMICPADAQSEIFGGDTCLISAGAVPSPHAVEQVDGGYRIRGTYGWASGSPYSTHYLGAGKTADGEGVMFLAPRAGYSIVDDWSDVLGMRGSGSNSVEIDVVVPESHILRQTLRSLAVQGGSVGSDLHQNPMYALPTAMSLSGAVIVSVAVGAAWAAFDEYKRAVATRTAVFTPNPDGSGRPPPRSEVEEFQLYLGDAFGKLSCAEAVVLRGGDMMMEFSRENVSAGGTDPKWDDHIMAMVLNAAEQAVDVVHQLLVPSIGSTNVVRSDERMQRYIRDLLVISSHRVMSYRHRNRVTLGQMEIKDPAPSPAA